MASLRLREIHLPEQATRLSGIVVRNRGLEVLAERSRLAQLPPEPPEKADRRLALHATEEAIWAS